jgi:bifunctional DNase/RNase
VTKVVDHSIYASVLVDNSSGDCEVDCRPSDALNLALVLGVPIQVARDVIDDDYEGRDGWQYYQTRAADLVKDGYPL